MSPQSSSEKAEAFKANSERITDGIRNSLSGIAKSAIQYGSESKTPGPKQYTPPFGSQKLPHPRTIPDIVFRGLVIELCAALAYVLFLKALRQTVSKNRRRLFDLPGPSWIWPLLSVLLPELVLVQIGLELISGLCPSFVDILGIQSTTRLKSHRTQRNKAPETRAVTLALQSIFLVVPLYYAGKAYRQRLALRYDTAIYIANLGLDHRNGWSVVSGLVCGFATLLLALLSTFKRSQPTAAKRSGVVNHLDAIEEVDEGEDWDDEKDGQSTGNRRKHSQESQRQPHNHGSISSAPSKASSSDQNSITALLHNPEAILVLVLTTIIHQIPLAATNRLPPLTAIIMTRWCLILPFVVFLSAFILPHSQRLALQRALFSRSGNDKLMVMFTLLRTTGMVLPWLLVGSTILVQTWSDLSELINVGRGVVQPWNYRWLVKDIFSHGDADRVYMG